MTAGMVQESAPAGTSTRIVVYDVGSVGHGASGAAAGLLHPFQPKGKLVWKGMEGFEATQRLMRVSQDALSAQPGTAFHLS